MCYSYVIVGEEPLIELDQYDWMAFKWVGLILIPGIPPCRISIAKFT
jgi:hypothetical protein